MLQLPEEILLLITAHLGQSSLAALLQVCRRFRSVLEPLFYRSVTVDYCSLREWRGLVSSATARANLSHTRTYNVEFLTDVSIDSESGPILQLLLETLQAMPGLRSFKACYFLVTLLQKPVPGKGMTICDQLLKAANLTELLLYCDGEPWYNFEWSLPRFANLISLALHRLCEDRDGHVSEIGEILLASPGLEHLALSYRHQAGLDDFFYDIIQYFHEKREERGRSRLHLRGLHLGIGTTPCVHPVYPEDKDYIAKLTDLTFLDSLRLDNMHHYVDGYEVAVPFLPIIPELFDHAHNLHSLTVERFGPDILALVHHIQEVQALTNSTSFSTLQVLEYGTTIHFDGEEPGLVESHENTGDPIYAVPLHEAGYAWRRLCYSGFPNRNDPKREDRSIELLRYVSQCSQLEELMVPIHNRDEMEFLKKEVLPKLLRLRVLHFPWADLARDFLVGLHRPRPSPWHLRRKSEEEKAESQRKDREVDREREQKRIVVVRDIFEYHQTLQRQQPEMVPLTHVAINEEVYVRHFPLPGDENGVDDAYMLPDGSRIVRLPVDEARKVGIVEILHNEEIFDLGG